MDKFNMKTCRYCGKEVPVETNFCWYCARELESRPERPDVASSTTGTRGTLLLIIGLLMVLVPLVIFFLR